MEISHQRRSGSGLDTYFRSGANTYHGLNSLGTEEEFEIGAEKGVISKLANDVLARERSNLVELGSPCAGEGGPLRSSPLDQPIQPRWAISLWSMPIPCVDNRDPGRACAFDESEKPWNHADAWRSIPTNTRDTSLRVDVVVLDVNYEHGSVGRRDPLPKRQRLQDRARAGTLEGFDRLSTGG
jgi:hypothetical protein